MPDESVDLILTDPPYNISVKNNFHTLKGRHGIDFGEWDKGFDLTGWIPNAIRILKSGGNIIIFNAWRNMGQIADMLEQNGCLIKEMIQQFFPFVFHAYRLDFILGKMKSLEIICNG